MTLQLQRNVKLVQRGNIMNKQIESLKLALTALEINLTLLKKITPYKGQEDFLSDSIAITQDTTTAIKEALAQPEPYCYTYKENDEDFFAPKDGYYPPDAKPLYTTPPQRTWVGLTEEEAMDVTRKEGHDLLDFIYEYGTGVEGVEERIVAICKAIEAKLKEKNCD